MSKMIVDRYGAKRWFLNGKLHREGGPAIEYANGSKKWYNNGLLHGEDGPAIEWEDGSKEWWYNGSLHREDGPAIEFANGGKQWWLNGKRLTRETWFEMLPGESKVKALFSEQFIKR